MGNTICGVNNGSPYCHLGLLCAPKKDDRPPLKAVQKEVSPEFLFRYNWYVIACTVTPFDRDCYDAVERYEWTDEKKQEEFKVIYRFRSGSHEAPVSTMYQDGKVYDSTLKSEWRVRPRFFGGKFHIGFWLPYIILDCPADSFWERGDLTKPFIVGYPDRSLLWIMSRDPNMTESAYQNILSRCEKEWGYDREKILDKLWRVPHNEKTRAVLEKD